MAFLHFCAFRVFLLTKILFAYSIFISYLLQFYVPLDFLEPHLFKAIRLERFKNKFASGTERKVIHTVAQLALRTVIVLMTGEWSCDCDVTILSDHVTITCMDIVWGGEPLSTPAIHNFLLALLCWHLKVHTYSEL